MNAVDIIASWLAARPPELDQSPHTDFWLDCRRDYRLVECGAGLWMALHRNGRFHVYAPPAAQPLPEGEEVTREIFDILEKASHTKTAEVARPRRSIFARFFNR